MPDVYDFNNSGPFTLDLILAEYRRLCKQHRVSPDPAFLPHRTDTPKATWIYPIWHQVAEGVRGNHPACIDLGIWCLEVPDPIRFGRSIRSTLVRELRRANLSTIQTDRLLKAIARLLLSRHPNVHSKRLIRLFFHLKPKRYMLEPFRVEQDDPFIEERRLAVLDRADEFFRRAKSG